jgi:hypothetical protein
MPKFDGNIEDDNFVHDLSIFFENQGIKISSQINQIVQKAMSDNLTIENGIIQNENNSTVITRAKKLLLDYFESKSYQGYLNNMIFGISQITDAETWIQNDLNDIQFSDNFVSKNISPVEKMFFDFTKNRLGISGFESNAIHPIEQSLLTSINAGETLTQATRRVRDLTIGTKSDKGKFLKYAQQTTRDVYFGHDGTINQTIAESYGLKNIRYLGSLVKDSRPQCKRWVKMKTIPFDDLRKEIAWANKQKKNGMRKGTTPSNFITVRGGYNCRHRAVPIK